MNRNVVVYETLSTAHLFSVLWYWVRGYTFYYHQVTERALTKWWFRRLRDSNRLHQLEFKTPWYMCPVQAGDLAFEIVDPIYDTFYRNHPQVKRVERAYASEETHLAFKKGLLGDLDRHLYYLLFQGIIRDALPDARRLVFVPHNFFFARLPSRYRPYVERLDELRSCDGPPMAMCFWGRALAVRTSWQRKIRACLFGVHAVLTAWAKSAGSRRRVPVPQRFDFAVTVITTVREAADGFRDARFLLDGTRIRVDNTLVVPMVRLSLEHRREIEELGFTIAEGVEPGGRSVPGGLTPSFAVLYRLTSIQRAVLTGVFSSPAWLTETAAYMGKDYWTWNSFAKTYDVGDFVTNVDFGLRQIGRNIVLNQHDTRTWYYLDSLNTGEASFIKGNGNPYRTAVWGFLKYDYCVSWNDRHIAYFKLHKQEIGDYIPVGCMWSEHVRLFREGAIPSSIREKLIASGYDTRLKLLAVFDTSYGQGTLIDFKDGAQFLRDMERLVAHFPGVFLAFKEKKPRRYLGFDTSTKVQGDSHGMGELIQRLEKHERFCFLGYDANPSEILAACDLAISYPFTSTTLEAIGAGGKGIYYDPTGKRAGSSYDRVYKLVVQGFEELQERVDDLLYHTTDEEYRQYLDQHVKGVLDPYVDGLALTRFRDLLCNGTRADVAPGHTATVEAAIPGLGLQATEQGAAPVEPIS